METCVICKFSSTAAATFRQAVALIFDHVVRAESLPSGKFGSGGYVSRASSVTGDVSRSIHLSEYGICLNITAQLFFLHVVSVYGLSCFFCIHLSMYEHLVRHYICVSSVLISFLFIWAEKICLHLRIFVYLYWFLLCPFDGFTMNRSLEHESVSRGSASVRETLTRAGKLGLHLLEDLTALAASGSVWTIYEINVILIRHS